MSTLSNAPGLRWLDGACSEEVAEWREVWAGTPCRRPHDHPGFLELMRQPEDHATAVVFDAPGARVLYPFYWRSLAQLPYADGGPAIHLISPYGYGGPVYQGPEADRVAVGRAFEAALEEELRRRGAVSEFVREDLFEERLVPRAAGERLEQQKNVVVRLDRSPEETWRQYKAKVRKNVNTAGRAGLRVCFDPGGERLSDFLAVYTDTMTRTQASKSFFISEQRFRELGDSLGRDGGLLYVHVLDGDSVVSTELLLLSTEGLYSFLGGTSVSSFEKRPNDLLKHEVIGWGRARGLRHYVLGGGVTPGDGIFVYKEAFDPGSVLPFYIRRVRHDLARYDGLVARRRAHELAAGREWAPREDFFPAFLS